MTEAHLIKFLRLLGYEDHQMKSNNGWINVTCPLAKYKHASGRDSHPSAGFYINSEGKSYFKCFTCTPEPISLENFVIYRSMKDSYKDTRLSKFYQAWEIHFGKEGDDFNNYFKEEIEHKFKFNVWNTPRIASTSDILETPKKFPDRLLNIFPLLGSATDKTALLMKDYLINHRKISLSVIIETGIRYSRKHNLILFPLTDFKGNVQVLRARLADSSQKKLFSISAKHLNSGEQLPTIRDSGALFGAHLIVPGEPVIIVEGELDCMLLKTYGYNNVVATTTASFSGSQIHNIPLTDLWVGFDNDLAGKEATKRLISLARGKMIHIINWANAGAKDPGDADSKIDVDRAIKKRTLALKNNLTFYYGCDIQRSTNKNFNLNERQNKTWVTGTAQGLRANRSLRN